MQADILTENKNDFGLNVEDTNQEDIVDVGLESVRKAIADQRDGTGLSQRRVAKSVNCQLEEHRCVGC